MLANNVILIVIIIINSLIGLVIKASNPARSQNKQFFILSFILTIWMLFVFSIMNATSEEAANALIRAATIAAVILPFQLGMLLQSIQYPDLSTWRLLRNNRTWALIGIAISILCLTKMFMRNVIMPSAEHPTVTVPEAQYNVGFFIFAAYFFISLLLALYRAIRAMAKSTGVIKLEIQYVLLGGGVMLVSGFFISLILPWLTQTTQVQQYGPVSVIAMNFIIAYGIATRRILDVGTVIRKIVAYTLLLVYLVVIYLGVWSFVKYILFRFAPNSDLLAQITAAVVMAFSMAPVHGRFQKVADKLVTSHAMDIPSTMKKAGDMFQSVTTIDALLRSFSKLLMTALGADDMRILLGGNTDYAQQYPKNSKPSSSIPISSTVADMIRQTKDPVSADTLLRIRKTEKTNQAIQELKDLNTTVSAGIFTKEGLQGLVLFGHRRGGRIYDKAEQDALQILCNQFAVALENAQMYTQMQDSKIRNEIMLDQLVSGVIVASPERKITLINNEAQRITGFTEPQALGQHIDMLPETISKALETTLTTSSRVRNVDALLFAQEEDSIHIRMGSAYLLGHDNKPMGALLVFTDMTELKQLEQQVRRSDQLSSVGTLAAGMAHEIKNPLVTIKTFTQLLPERYEDTDFREDFSSLVAHEVSRIDGIVNQLLSFSKPTKPHLETMNFHATVEQTLKLIHEQLAQKNITLNNSFQAEQDLISGDADLLTQALVNLNLNAIDAIDKDGCITVGTTNCTYRFANGTDPDRASAVSCIRLQISDTGTGISKDHLQKIFDPFFTNKSGGTGMGLSVSHGIIQEHSGVIEVESEQGKGTTFYIYLPILKEVRSA